jgi:hypothetical protein
MSLEVTNLCFKNKKDHIKYYLQHLIHFNPIALKLCGHIFNYKSFTHEMLEIFKNVGLYYNSRWGFCMDTKYGISSDYMCTCNNIPLSERTVYEVLSNRKSESTLRNDMYYICTKCDKITSIGYGV